MAEILIHLWPIYHQSGMPRLWTLERSSILRHLRRIRAVYPRVCGGITIA